MYRLRLGPLQDEDPRTEGRLSGKAVLSQVARGPADCSESPGASSNQHLPGVLSHVALPEGARKEEGEKENGTNTDTTE